MAINIFLTGRTADMSSLSNFLETNKAGTFLENTTIVLSTTTAANDTLTFTGKNAVLRVRLFSTATSASTVMSYTGKYISGSMTNTTGYNTIAEITGALLGNNGLLFSFSGTTNSNPASYTFYCCTLGVTVDSTGDLAVIYGANAVTTATINSYRVLTYNSTVINTATCYPQFNAPLTSLAPIVPTCDDNSIILPYAYAALHTQLADKGLQGVVIDGANYITNGYWYIRD